MEPIQYLIKVEPVLMHLFSALQVAELRAESETRVLRSERDHHRYLVQAFKDENSSHSVNNLDKTLLLLHTGAAAAAGAILQIAKTYIALAWPNENPPIRGRRIGEKTLSEVIWYARNQAMHFEEEKLHPPTQRCLEALPVNWNLDIPSLKAHPRSLARDIVLRLGWNNFESFADEMHRLFQDC